MRGPYWEAQPEQHHPEGYKEWKDCCQQQGTYKKHVTDYIQQIYLEFGNHNQHAMNQDILPVAVVLEYNDQQRVFRTVDLCAEATPDWYRLDVLGHTRANDLMHQLDLRYLDKGLPPVGRMMDIVRSYLANVEIDEEF